MDIRMATIYARHMILEWGMSDRLGFVNYAGDDTRDYFMPERGYSEDTARIIDEEIKRLTDEAYADAERIISENWSKVIAIAEALLKYETLGLRVHACAIMPDHVHAVIARHPMTIEEIGEHLKRAATRELNRRALHPLRAHPDPRGRYPTPWGKGGWYPFLSSAEEMRSRIPYVVQNPIKAGLPVQKWDFILPFEQ